VMSDTRRFRFSLAASLLVNALLLPLAAWFWRPLPVAPPPVRLARIRLVTLALRLPPHAPAPRLAVPPLRPIRLHVPKPPPPRPPRPQPRHRPGAHVRAATPAPPAQPTGGAEAGAPAPTSIAPAPPLKVVTTTRPAVRIAAHVETSAPALVAAPPALVLAPMTISAPTPPAPVVAAGLGGGAKAGKEAGTGAGSGQGSEAGPGAGKAGAGPFGVGAGLPGDGAPRHVVYVLDISGSMTSRVGRADQELARALDGLRPSETFNIVVFSDDARAFARNMAPATPSQIRRAKAFLAALEVIGGTNLEAAMRLALRQADVNEVMLLTDGVPTGPDGPYPPEEFPRIARDIDGFNTHRARISTIGLVGVSPDGEDQSFEAALLLKRIAHDSGGASELVPLGTADP